MVENSGSATELAPDLNYNLDSGHLPKKETVVTEDDLITAPEKEKKSKAQTAAKEMERINLTNDEIAEVRNQIKLMHQWRKNPHFAFANKDFEIEVVYKEKVKLIIGKSKDEIRCTDCIGHCDDAYETEQILVCPKLPKTLHEETKTKKVGKYTYKYLPNQSQNYYWYLQFTEYFDVVKEHTKKKVGKSKSIYLGKMEPTFNPEKDLKKVRSKKKPTKPRNAAIDK